VWRKIGICDRTNQHKVRQRARDEDTRPVVVYRIAEAYDILPLGFPDTPRPNDLIVGAGRKYFAGNKVYQPVAALQELGFSVYRLREVRKTPTVSPSDFKKPGYFTNAEQVVFPPTMGQYLSFPKAVFAEMPGFTPCKRKPMFRMHLGNVFEESNEPAESGDLIVPTEYIAGNVKPPVKVFKPRLTEVTIALTSAQIKVLEQAQGEGELMTVVNKIVAALK